MAFMRLLARLEPSEAKLVGLGEEDTCSSIALKRAKMRFEEHLGVIGNSPFTLKLMVAR